MITFVGFALSIVGWFLWNLLIGAIHPVEFGPYVVRGSFVNEFGNKLGWWAAAGATIAAVVAFELGLTAFQRIYYPRDQDIWQEIERQGGVSEVLKEHAAEEGRVASRLGDPEGQSSNNDDDSEQGRPLSPIVSEGASNRNRFYDLFTPSSSAQRSPRSPGGAGAYGPATHKGKRVETA